MPRTILAILPLPLLALAAAPPTADRCAAARQATGYVCQATAGGVVLAANQAGAARLAVHATAGEARWRDHFGSAVTSYAVVENLGPGMTKALHAAGFPIVLPWLNPGQYVTASTESVRRATEMQVKAQGITDLAQVRGAVDQAVTAWQAKHPPAEWLGKEAGAVPHEIGHMWYIARYWPRAAVDGTGHYGGPGPDWMDETAAVLMEDDQLANDRRKQFATYFADQTPTGTGARTTLTDLAAFLHREHPAKAMSDMIAARAGSSSGPRVMVVSAEEAKGQAQAAGLFYLQARMFADYLIAKSGNPAVFADIGTAFGRGQSIEQWLAARGKHWHLGLTVEALQEDWKAWLAGNQGDVNRRASPGV